MYHSLIYSTFFLCDMELKNTTQKHITHCCSFITMKTHTGVNFDPHPLVLLSQNPLEPQMWIHPLLNIVPNKCTIFSCLCDLKKNYSVQLFQEITKPFFKNETTSLWVTFKDLEETCEAENVGKSGSRNTEYHQPLTKLNWQNVSEKCFFLFFYFYSWFGVIYKEMLGEPHWSFAACHSPSLSPSLSPVISSAIQ